MPRIPYPDLARKPEAVRAFCEQQPVNLTRMMAHATPSTFTGFNKYVSTLYLDSALPADLREIGILQAGYTVGALYETTHHEAIARSIGLQDLQIEAIKTTDTTSPHLSQAQKATLAFAAAFIRDGRVSAPILEAIRQHISDEGLMDLMLVIGTYMTVSRILLTTDLPLDQQVLTGDNLTRSLEAANTSS